MDVLTLLDEGEAAGLAIRLDGDRLTLSGPRKAAPLARAIGERKPDVLAAWWTWQAQRLLRQVDDPDLRQDLADDFDEIAASREYELNHDRREAEQVAFGATVAAMLARGLPVRCSIERERAV